MGPIMKYGVILVTGIAFVASSCATGYSPALAPVNAQEPEHTVRVTTNGQEAKTASIPNPINRPVPKITAIEQVDKTAFEPLPTLHKTENVKNLDLKNKVVSDYSPAPKQTYKRLEYGAHKPLVCKDHVPAKGKLHKRPNLQVMWENYLYPRPEGIWSEIGGYVEINGNLPLDQGRWTNACTIRLSHMLLKAGHRIPQRFGITSSAANKDQYIYRLSDMEDYLVEILGEPDFKITDGSARWWDLPHTPGIVLIDFPGHNSFTGHTTVWNGAGTVDGSDITGDQVLFWELPCFIPDDRLDKDNKVDEPEILAGDLDASVTALP